MRMTYRPVALTCLLVLLLASAAMAQPGTPFTFKEEAIAALEGTLPTGHSRSDRRIEKAIDAIEASLAPELWEDANHLVNETGVEVFQAEIKAIRKLQKVLEDGFAPEVVEAIENLIFADVTLSEIAINEALAAEGVADCDAGDPGNGGGSDSDSDSGSDSDSDSGSDSDSDSGFGTEIDCDCAKALRRIASAEEQQSLAFQAFDADDYQAAAIALKRSWKKAVKAQLAVAACPVLDVPCPCVNESMPVFSSFADGSRPVAGCAFDQDGDDAFVMTIDVPASFAEVIIVPSEGLAVCTEQDRVPDPDGPVTELFLTPAAAAGCVDVLRDLVVDCPCDSNPATPIPDCILTTP